MSSASAFWFNFSIPGKVFLLGEYAALEGLPALVAAVGPGFVLRARSADRFESSLTPASPAGRLLDWARHRVGPGDLPLHLEFEDPHRGAGGFGASTAQFALVYFALAEAWGWGDEARRWESPWKLYRELTAGEPVPPSGADLVAQWQGSVTLFDARERLATDLWPTFDWSGLLVFSTLRKLPTHDHLSALATLPGPLLARLEGIVGEGVRAVREGSPSLLGHAFTAYAEALAAEGLETAPAREDRLALSGLPGVLGCKGSGAGLNDVVLVLLEPRTHHRETVVRAAEARGLRLVADGLPAELGARRCP